MDDATLMARDAAQPAAGRERLLMVSSDCHASPRIAAYEEFMESRYHGELKSYAEALAQKSLSTTDLRAQGNKKDARGRTPEEIEEENRRRKHFATDLPARIAPLEADGFVSEVLFPDGGANNQIPFAGLFGNPAGFPTELHAAALRAHNRWATATATPEQQVGLGLVPLHDPDYAVAQVEGMRNQILRGVLVIWDGMDPAYPGLDDARLDRFWAACVDAGLPVHFHFGSGAPAFYADARKLIQPALMFETVWWSHRPLWHLILGGVAERHPGLKVVFAETRYDWVPRVLQYIDWEWEGGKLAHLPMKPSLYWARQFYVGATTPSLIEHGLRHELGVDRCMYGTDFPHVSSPWGISTEFLQATLRPSGYTESETRAFLGGIAADLYGLDTARLRPIADRVGPYLDQLLTTPDGDAAKAAIESKNVGIHRAVDRPHSMF